MGHLSAFKALGGTHALVAIVKQVYQCITLILSLHCAESPDPTKNRRAEARLNKDLAKIDNISSHLTKSY